MSVDLESGAMERLQRLMGSWGTLADLCFGDLLLFVPVSGNGGSSFMVLGQMRPSTSQTLHRDDLVGRVMDEGERPLVARAWRRREIVEGELSVRGRGERARTRCIPVRHDGSLVAVMSREVPFGVGRRPGELERVYGELFDRLGRMIFEGTFPFAADEATVAESPRVGDGVVVLDDAQRVIYASPNAVNALHRMGVHTRADGASLEDLGVEETAVSRAFTSGTPVTEEVEGRPDVAVLLRCLPLISKGRVDGALVLLRDVTDLRRRDRLLLSKDATIREVHHRVKNNLQTISSLLRLQGRRLASAEAKSALREAEVRVRSIAIVHEILSREVGEQASFDEIVKALVRMSEDAVVTSRPFRIRVEGKAGEVAAEVATPLAVVLTELLQNSATHAFHDDDHSRSGAPGRVLISMSSDGRSLEVGLRDNGCGLPGGFRIEETTGLGLSIVRDLVVNQLRGTIEMRSEEGTVVELRVPLPAADTATLEVGASP